MRDDQLTPRAQPVDPTVMAAAVGRGAPQAIVMVMVATGGLLMFDAWWWRLGSACPLPCRGRPRHCRRSPSWPPRLTVVTIMIADWRLA